MADALREGNYDGVVSAMVVSVLKRTSNDQKSLCFSG